MNALKRLLSLLFTFCLCFMLFAFSPPADAAAEAALQNPADHSAELVRMMNLNLRYILNTWWPSEKDYVYAAATNTNRISSPSCISAGNRQKTASVRSPMPFTVSACPCMKAIMTRKSSVCPLKTPSPCASS